MNKVNLIKHLQFSNELVKQFDRLSEYLDFYFKKDVNIENNKEFYEYYKKFGKDVTNIAIKYGVFKK